MTRYNATNTAFSSDLNWYFVPKGEFTVPRIRLFKRYLRVPLSYTYWVDQMRPCERDRLLDIYEDEGYEGFIAALEHIREIWCERDRDADAELKRRGRELWRDNGYL